jgi:hypothetical protein
VARPRCRRACWRRHALRAHRRHRRARHARALRPRGRPGAAGLDGLVFIDGAGREQPLTAEEARAALADLGTGSPWLTFGGIAAPFAGLFNSAGSLSVKLAPDQPSDGRQSGLLPANLVPPVRVTNAGQYGFALDTATSPAGLAAAQAHLGHLAAAGDPRGWDDAGELTPLDRYATIFSGWGLRGLDGTAWYHPRRLTLDAGAVANGVANPAQDRACARPTAPTCRGGCACTRSAPPSAARGCSTPRARWRAAPASPGAG